MLFSYPAESRIVFPSASLPPSPPYRMAPHTLTPKVRQCYHTLRGFQGGIRTCPHPQSSSVPYTVKTPPTCRRTAFHATPWRRCIRTMHEIERFRRSYKSETDLPVVLALKQVCTTAQNIYDAPTTSDLRRLLAPFSAPATSSKQSWKEARRGMS